MMECQRTTTNNQQSQIDRFDSKYELTVASSEREGDRERESNVLLDIELRSLGGIVDIIHKILRSRILS
jgi:hypothetical protein